MKSLTCVAAVLCFAALLFALPGHAAAEDYLGDIKLTANGFAQRNWAYCEGQTLPIASNTALFSLLGTNYGGDGRTTFKLPDMREAEKTLRKQVLPKAVAEKTTGPLRYIICIKGTYPSRN